MKNIKRFFPLVMVVSLGLFAIGCGKDSASNQEAEELDGVWKSATTSVTTFKTENPNDPGEVAIVHEQGGKYSEAIKKRVDAKTLKEKIKADIDIYKELVKNDKKRIVGNFAKIIAVFVNSNSKDSKLKQILAIAKEGLKGRIDERVNLIKALKAAKKPATKSVEGLTAEQNAKFDTIVDKIAELKYRDTVTSHKELDKSLENLTDLPDEDLVKLGLDADGRFKEIAENNAVKYIDLIEARWEKVYNVMKSKIESNPAEFITEFEPFFTGDSSTDLGQSEIRTKILDTYAPATADEQKIIDLHVELQKLANSTTNRQELDWQLQQ